MGRIWIDTQIYKNPPQSEGRLNKEMDTYTLLQKLGIPFLRLDHGAAAVGSQYLQEPFSDQFEKNALLYARDRVKNATRRESWPGRFSRQGCLSRTRLTWRHS